MSQEIRQTVKTEQGLAITPQLKRSLDILQAPALEVEKIIENEIRTNPLLEEVPNEPNPAPEMLGDGGEHEDFESSEEKVPAIPKRERREGISYSGSSLDSDAQEKRDFFILTHFHNNLINIKGELLSVDSRRVATIFSYRFQIIFKLGLKLVVIDDRPAPIAV